VWPRGNPVDVIDAIAHLPCGRCLAAADTMGDASAEKAEAGEA
jgi:hypothetical protein